jgi:hypothetical protein
MSPDRREDLRVLLGGRDRLTVRVLVHSDREDPPHAAAPRVAHELTVVGLADAEMRMGIAHGRSLGWRPYGAGAFYAAAASIFGNSGGSFSTPWPPPCAPNGEIAASSTPSASSIRSPVSGM